MAQANIVSSVSYVPFRRFLPHEKQGALAHFSVVDNSPTEDSDSNEERRDDRPVATLLSSEDMQVLLQAGHPEDSYYPSDADYDEWHVPQQKADAEYLPFTFALAATNH